MIKSVCGYCGVGCGLEFNTNHLIGDIAYPANEGNVCPNGVSELISIQTPTRLLQPYIRYDIKSDYKTSSWDDTINTIAKKIKSTSKDKIGFIGTIDCKPNWEIFQLIARKLCFNDKFNFENSKEILKSSKR